MKGRVFVFAFGLSVAMACGSTNSTGAEQPHWLSAQHGDRNYAERNMFRYCDIETGNLLYQWGDSRGGIAVVPGGCK